MLPATRTPVALPAISMPLAPLPEITLVRMRLLPPVEVIEHPVQGVAHCRVHEGRQAAEGVENHGAAGRVGDLDAVLAVGRVDVAQRDDAAELRVRGRAFDEHAVESVAQRGGVVVGHAENVGLDRGVVGVGDPQAVAAVAADHVVDRRTACCETVVPIRELLSASTMATPSRVLPKAACR